MSFEYLKQRILILNLKFYTNNRNSSNKTRLRILINSRQKQLQTSLTKQMKRSKRSKQFKQITDQTTTLYDRVTKLQTEILDKFLALKHIKSKVVISPCPHLILKPECQDYDPKNDYYEMFWKLYMMNEVKRDCVDKWKKEVGGLERDISWIQRKFEKYQKLVSYRNGVRRGGEERGEGNKYRCEIEGCGKTYQSIGALDLHHRIKHESDKQESEEASLVVSMKKNANKYQRKN